MDGSDFFSPRDYHVRTYNSKLEHQNHYVSAYKTEVPSTIIYTIHKLLVNVVIHLVTDGIFVTYIGPHKGSLNLPKNTDVREILKVALSLALDKPVTISDNAQPTLF